jgi:hypothetical protein
VKKQLTVALAETDSVTRRTIIAENLTIDLNLNYEWARAQKGGRGV